MNVKFIALALCAIFLTACYSGPSASDAKAVIVGRLSGGCSRIAIKDFEKVNGLAETDSSYEVSIKYLLVIKPPEGNDITYTQYSTQIQALEQQYLGLDQERTAIQKQETDPSITVGGHEELEAALRRHEFELSHQMSDLAVAKQTLMDQPRKDFMQACPNLDGRIIRAIDEGWRDSSNENPGNHGYLSGFSVSVTDTLHMVKTDNGWQEGL